MPICSKGYPVNQHALNTIDPKIIGERLAESRQARRLTQQQVADALNLSRSTMIAMEKGERRPKATELVSLSKLFGRPVSDFVAMESLTDEPSFAVFFRKAHGSANATRLSGQSAGIEMFERHCLWYLELEEMLGSPLPRRYPETYNIEGTPPERAAEEVASSERNRLGLGDGPVSNLMDLLETDVGLRIFSIEMQNRAAAGMYLYTERFGGCIAVNADHPEERQRWSAAHGYAHFLTDRQRPDISVLRSSRRVPREERFADAFASCFLMPDSGLVRRFGAIRRSKQGRPATPADVLMLASLYGVSFQAMAQRLEDLRLLSANALDQLKQVGGHIIGSDDSASLRSEPPEQPRQPVRYSTLAVQAFEEALLTEGQLAERLGTDILGARAIVDTLTDAWQPTRDGHWQRDTHDLSTEIVGTS